MCAKICEKHTCRCVKLFEENGNNVLSCARSAGCFSWHHKLKSVVKQALSSFKVPSILKPYGLTRTDGKRQDGITLVFWEEGNKNNLGCHLCRSSRPQQNRERFCCQPRYSSRGCRGIENG